MKYVKGNLIDLFKQDEFDLIAHQCNCKGLYYAGIAGALYKEFPEIDIEIYDLWDSVDKFGTIEPIDTDYGKIINMYSQFNPGRCTKSGIDSFEVRLAALKNCLKDISIEYPGKRIGIPLVASGIAADKERKEDLNDLEYFQTFIAKHVYFYLLNLDVTIVYL